MKGRSRILLVGSYLKGFYNSGYSSQVVIGKLVYMYVLFQAFACYTVSVRSPCSPVRAFCCSALLLTDHLRMLLVRSGRCETMRKTNGFCLIHVGLCLKSRRGVLLVYIVENRLVLKHVWNFQSLVSFWSAEMLVFMPNGSHANRLA